MARRNQAEEIARAADRITDAVQEFTSTLNRLLEFQEKAWDRFEHGQRSEGLQSLVYPFEYRSRELPEEEAVRIALAATHEAREDMGLGMETEERLPAPSPEEVRRRREERRKREDDEDRS